MRTVRPKQVNPARWTLWHRASRRHKWRLIGSAERGAVALALMDSSGIKGGDWMLIDDGRDPNEKVQR